MRITKTALSLLTAAIAIATETVVAQGFGAPSIPVPTNAVPITVSGRIVKPNGDPLPGVQIAGMLQTESMMGGVGPSFPVVKAFTLPKICFTDGATVTTDADGRFTYRINFLPDPQINMRGDKCSSLRGSLTAANATVAPVLGQALMQQYDFERATGPLPTKVLIQGNIDVTPKAPIGGAPLQMKK